MDRYLTLADYRRAIKKNPSLRDTRLDAITLRPMARRRVWRRIQRWLTRRHGI
jgi:hypothetical protein